jgi:predicted metal-dependent phosphoesterase TrpH
MIRVELHCHTYHSIDSLMLPGKILATLDRKRIDRVAITDHNTIAGALELYELAPHRIIPGEEVKTTAGELLAYFIREEVPKGLPPLEAIQALRQQGAFISVAHPFDRMRSNQWTLEQLEEIAPLIDAVEVFNSRTHTDEPNREAGMFAAQHQLPGTAGSDAHAYFEIGRTTITCPDFSDADTLRQALAAAEIHPGPSRPWVHLTSQFAMIQKARGWMPPDDPAPE